MSKRTRINIKLERMSTPSTSDLFSALQKFIRRGRHENAIAVGNELCNRMFPSHVQLFDRLWRRLFVISTEDVGVAQRGTIRTLQGLHASARKHFEARETEQARKFCLEAILTLSHSPKSRLTDNAYIWFARNPPTETPPESLYDASTLYTLVETKDEEALLELIASSYRHRNHPGLAIQAKSVCEAASCSLAENNLLMDELTSLWEAYSSDNCVLYLMHMGLLVCRPPSNICIEQHDLPFKIPSLPSKLPDFCYDKHTRKGRQLNRGLRHFVEVGSLLENCSIPDPYYPRLLQHVCMMDETTKLHTNE